MDNPGISVLKAATPTLAAEQIRAAFPHARALQEAAKFVASTSEHLIRHAGFEISPAPSRALPNHHRITHPEGAAGFSEENLERLSQAFVTSTGLGI